MSSTMPTTNSRADRLATMSQNATSWVLGSGLLSFHAGTFFVVMTSLTLWNIYHTPANIWVMDLLRLWGAVIIFHAIAVLAGMAATRLMRAGEPSAAPAIPIGYVGPVANDPVTTTSRNGASPEWGAQPTNGSAPAALTDGMARWTRGAVAEATARWHSVRNVRQSDPTGTWPTDGQPQRSPEETEFIARFGGGPGAQSNASQSEDRLIRLEPGSAGTPRAPKANGAAPGAAAKGGHFSWVEAAAGTWLSRRDDAPPAHRANATNHGANGAGEPQVDPPPALPPSDDSSPAAT